VRIWNVGAERLYGWGGTEVLGKPYDILFEDADREAGLPARQLAEALRTGSFHGRSWRLGKGGRRFLVEANISSINDYYGKHIGFGQVVRDITEENLRAQQIEASEAQLRSILETVPDAMVTIDERGRVESFSKAAERLFGYRADEVIGQNVAMLMPADEAERHDGYLARYHATGERRIIGFQRRVMGQRKDGSIFPHELFVSEAYGGGRRFYTGFLRDLTEREAAQASLHELQAELIHISRVSAVGTMATALAHELNQPLTSIANYVQSSAIMIANGETQMLALVHEALIEAGNEALRAGAIVQRLREFIVRGDPERTLVSLNDLAREACALGAIGGGMRGISCDIAIAPDLPEVLVDRVQVHQVLLNLIRNAFEAMTEGGKIFIKARREDLLICVSVEDNGPGIPAGTEETLFEPFVTSKTSGMGMGLAICRTIVEAHGGRLWCETTPEGGAAFRFTLPIAETDHD
jgi:two-component system sensor kinase FixL